jgi:SAM-dependent methyltransferase
MNPQVAALMFDLVVGAAILHHLEAPEQALSATLRALRPGGSALFFEPFDGYGILRLAFRWILAEASLRHAQLAAPVKGAPEAIAHDIGLRTRPSHMGPQALKMLDDKWLFSRERFERAAQQLGFASVSCVPHNDHPTFYRDVVHTQLRLATGEDWELPPWALQILDEFDASFSRPFKRLNMFEGTVVLTKAEQSRRVSLRRVATRVLYV